MADVNGLPLFDSSQSNHVYPEPLVPCVSRLRGTSDSGEENGEDVALSRSPLYPACALFPLTNGRETSNPGKI